MYAREVDGQELTLGVSGLLWNRSLVMYDKETNTWWSHILGEAKKGPLAGKQLEQVPSLMTDWQAWSKEHPDSKVLALSKTAGEYRREFYHNLDRFVLGIAERGKAKSWGFATLNRQGFLEDEWAGRPVVAVFDRESRTPRLFERTLEDEVLSFEMTADRIVDKRTGSVWSPVTGRALSGPLEGKHLAALSAFVSYERVWKTFYPESE